MKKILPLLILIAAFLPHIVNAQCTGCSSTLSGTSSNPFHKVVADGEVFCINSNGNLNRPIQINAGGILCNNGSISNNHIDIKEGGTLINNGTIEGDYIYFRQRGVIINNGYLKANDLFMDDAIFNNYNIAEIDKITIQIRDSINYFNNEGVIKSNIIQSHQTTSDSSIHIRYKIYNSGEIHVLEKLMISSRIDFENSGNLFVGSEIPYGIPSSSYGTVGFLNFYHCTHATFKNTGQIKIAGNFGNYGEFYTECMIPVGGNMVSSGRITGPLTNSCGGFNIEGYTYFVGYIADDFSYIDICDAGNPTGGFDQEHIEEMGPNVSFCSCNNECGPIDVFEDFVSTNDYTVSPNPISDNSVITFYNPIESYHQLMIFDSYGRVVKTYEGIVGNEIPIDRAGLDRGIYFFKIMSSYNVKAAGKLVVN